ncbi:unnamed protein product [Schistosoma margrebowiei]|uniref:beta-N-acetylhexosaminidase n=1 Tax=Schistosoma margrebowiei TaxID=48269 RepID=A0AA85AFC0_9TREM|nr:unnamed protein product [Schistosoma margrebowiei]
MYAVTTGHANSWGKGYPEILTKCYIKGEPDGTLGPINPINNISYNFVSQLYKELFSVFPDNWFHLGGDEVEYNCWRSNPSIIELMKKNSKDDAKLVIGGEAAMWGEYVDDTYLFSRSWPRGSAVAERLWTHGSPNTTDFIPRVEELRCRMLRFTKYLESISQLINSDIINNTTSRNTSADEGSDSRTIKSATKSTGNKTIGITGQKSGSTRGTSAKIDFNQAHWKMRIICKKIFSKIYS